MVYYHRNRPISSSQTRILANCNVFCQKWDPIHPPWCISVWALLDASDMHPQSHCLMIFWAIFWPRTFWRCDGAYQQKDTVELFKANMKRHGWSITTFLSVFFVLLLHSKQIYDEELHCLRGLDFGSYSRDFTRWYIIYINIHTYIYIYI
jgi:hypothetical protein